MTSAPHRSPSPPPRPGRRRPTSPAGAAVVDGLAIARRNLLRILRTPQLVFFSTIQPIMFVLLFNYVFGGAIDPTGGGSYIDYLLPGDHGADGGLRRHVDGGRPGHGHGTRHPGPLPFPSHGPLSRPVRSDSADAVRNLFVVLLIVTVGTLIGFRFHNGFVPAVAAILLAVLFGFAFSWVFAFIGLKTGRAGDGAAGRLRHHLPAGVRQLGVRPHRLDARVAPDLRQPPARDPDGQRHPGALSQGGEVAGPLTRALLWIAAIIAVFVPLAVGRYRKG